MKIHDLVLVVAMMTALAGLSTANAASPVTVYKSPTCGCCDKYVDYLRENGFAVNAVNESDMDAIKKCHGMSHVGSCHTALVNGYVVEGHVPVSAMRKLFKEKPAIIGFTPCLPNCSNCLTANFCPNPSILYFSKRASLLKL